MANSKRRPRAGAPPRLDEKVEILRELLEIERARLITAREIEVERRIVFPETSVIVRDIVKIMAAIEGKQAETVDEPDVSDGVVEFEM